MIGGSPSDDVKVQGYEFSTETDKGTSIQIPSGVGTLMLKIFVRMFQNWTKQVYFYLTFPFLITLLRQIPHLKYFEETYQLPPNRSSTITIFKEFGILVICLIFP